MLRIASLFLLAICAPIQAMPTNSRNGATKETILQSFECQCGDIEYLNVPHANISSPEQANQCADYKLIDARGTSEPQAASMMFYLLIENILANKTGGVSQSAEYPAALDQNTTSGENFVLDIINKDLQDCPQQKYALFGYSQGATLALNVLSQLDAKALDMLKAVILVGNPYHVPGQISNVNATAQPDPHAGFGMFVASASSSNSSIPTLSPALDRSGKVLDYCLEGDGVCHHNPDCPCYMPAAHLSYGLVDSVQTTAFDHIVSRL